MKHIFILDENVLLFAITGKNCHDEDDTSACNLILQMARNCHRVAWNHELKIRYSRKIDALLKGRTKPFANAQKVLFGLMTKQEKNLENESCLDLDLDLDDDKHVINLAISTSGILVTEDYRLKKKLERKKLVVKYGLKIVTPEEALAFADDR